MAKVIDALPDYLLDPNVVLLDDIPWRHGQAPDYTKANENYAQGKTVTHPPGSLGELVTNLVKNWEKEVSYKTRREDYRTINAEHYTFSVNGGKKRNLEEMQRLGTYSALIGDQALFCSSKMTFEESHKAFRRSMPDGFSFEVLEVMSGEASQLNAAREGATAQPSKLSFKWRHWGRMTGPLTCPLHNGLRMTAKPTNEVVSVIGMAYLTLNSRFQILDLEVYFDQNEPMSSMVRIDAPADSLQQAKRSQQGVRRGGGYSHRPSAESVNAEALSRSSSRSHTGRLSRAPSQGELVSRTPSQAEWSKLDIQADARHGTPREQAQASRSIWGSILNVLSSVDD